MVHSLDDTIVAVSTPGGASPIAIVRLTGPDAFCLLDALMTESPGPGVTAYSAREASLRLRPDGPRVPAALYLMPGPRSYTRQDVAEIHTLGSPPLVRMALDALVEGGARIAEPGEFTRRAFLNGRIDLAQAEAVLAVIQASTDGELRAAARALQGERCRHIHALHDDLVALRAQVEASIDFAEHDIELVAETALLDALEDALATVDDDLRNADAGVLPPEGLRVALCGLPNAGKSSLFNALLGHGRAIVTHVPGTTRDAIAEPLVLDGVRFRLYDTAGIAHDLAPIDDEAVVRSRGLIDGAHIAVVVIDGSTPLSDAERGLWRTVEAPQKILVLSKSDLAQSVSDTEAAGLAAGAPVCRVSAVGEGGPSGLEGLLVDSVRAGKVHAAATDLVWNARHRHALCHARAALRRARGAAEDG
ncbi:50S ribosome-binding GTPase, partial [bacterium]|nr:50S ribosome-binding GTPase [bacterium]